MQNPAKNVSVLSCDWKTSPKHHSTPLLNCCIESHYCVDKPKYMNNFLVGTILNW
ncbi:hypothetical protein PDJAM_G00033360 [Pangasius djambal]|uniref:Uncharacterized protein n=1 Tax=Pangasius djambal TaxID=1691987 RepID=A0ACC5YRI8_9TELE|nr:hypothetical protein [Pangasius djambal]